MRTKTRWIVVILLVTLSVALACAVFYRDSVQRAAVTAAMEYYVHNDARPNQELLDRGTKHLDGVLAALRQGEKTVSGCEKFEIALFGEEKARSILLASNRFQIASVQWVPRELDGNAYLTIEFYMLDGGEKSDKRRQSPRDEFRVIAGYRNGECMATSLYNSIE